MPNYLKNIFDKTIKRNFSVQRCGRDLLYIALKYFTVRNDPGGYFYGGVYGSNEDYPTSCEQREDCGEVPFGKSRLL